MSLDHGKSLALHLSIAGKRCWDRQVYDTLFPELYSVVGKSDSIPKHLGRGLHFHCLRLKKPLLCMSNIFPAGQLKREGTVGIS